jgi:signal peptidase I
VIDWDAPGLGKPAGGLPPMAPQPVPAKRTLLEILAIFLLAAVMVVVAKFVAVEVRFIPSASMVPQLQIQDRVLVSRWSYVLGEPSRGDIVVFPDQDGASLPSSESTDDGTNFFIRPIRDLGRWIGVVEPPEEEQDLIKRVIGLPGETVEGRDGVVYVDGRRLIEPYLPAGVFTSDFEPVAVPEGQLWVMGDNRGGSFDSRGFGPVPVDSLLGRAILRIWPIPKASFL